MIKIPLEIIGRPEIRRALAMGDWATVLRVITNEVGLSQTAISLETSISQPHISRLASGRVTEPGIRTVRLLCDGLGIPRSLAGLLDSEQEEVTNRRQLLGGALAVTGFASIHKTAGVLPDGVAEDVQFLAALSGTYRRLEHRMSSRLLISPVIAHVALLRHLRKRSDIPGLNGRRLATMTSESAGLVAWLYFDLDDRANARRYYRLAVQESLVTGHPLLPAYMQASFGHFAVTSGDPSQGVRLVTEARRNLPRSAPIIARVWLDAIEAVALAEYRDTRALAMVASAEDKLAHSRDDEPVWPWLFRFDEPKLATYRATVETKLSRLKAAQRSFEIAETAPRSPKQRAITDIERASVIAGLGDVEHACSVAISALRVGVDLGSERIVRAVADLRANWGSCANGAVAELDDRLHVVYKDEQI